jgi:hypothetical protein
MADHIDGMLPIARLRSDCVESEKHGITFVTRHIWHTPKIVHTYFRDQKISLNFVNMLLHTVVCDRPVDDVAQASKIDEGKG